MGRADGTHSTYRRAPVAESATGGAFRGRFTGHPIDNPRRRDGNWGWNRGVAWHPASAYWGGGFWGDYALASIAAIGIFGAIDDSQRGYAYDSYRVQPDTPGADLLNDYGLEQTGCGPSGLVAIWGPDGSVICAVPNGSVGPGNYQVDPETFTLVPGDVARPPWTIAHVVHGFLTQRHACGSYVPPLRYPISRDS